MIKLRFSGRSGVAQEADKAMPLLTPDKGANYDRIIELNLDTLEPHINGPFTPDLAHPISKLGAA
jgi:aconitate hydratase